MHLFDQSSKPFSCICSTTDWFRWCEKECHGWVQSMLPGGPTTWRKSLRQCTSRFRSSDLYKLRWPAPKTTESTNLIREFRETFLSHKLHLFAKAFKRKSKSAPLLPAFNVDNKHPTHLCALVVSKISICRLSWAVIVLPGSTCVVRILLLEAFSAKPTSFKQVTSASTIRAASSEGVAA